jgi:hypothetical protein
MQVHQNIMHGYGTRLYRLVTRRAQRKSAPHSSHPTNIPAPAINYVTMGHSSSVYAVSASLYVAQALAEACKQNKGTSCETTFFTPKIKKIRIDATVSRNSSLPYPTRLRGVGVTGRSQTPHLNQSLPS